MSTQYSTNHLSCTMSRVHSADRFVEIGKSFQNFRVRGHENRGSFWNLNPEIRCVINVAKHLRAEQNGIACCQMRKAVLLVQHPKNEIRSGMFGSHEKYVPTSFHTVQMLHCAPIVFLRNSGALQTLVSKEHLISKETIAGDYILQKIDCFRAYLRNQHRSPLSK